MSQWLFDWSHARPGTQIIRKQASWSIQIQFFFNIDLEQLTSEDAEAISARLNLISKQLQVLLTTEKDDKGRLLKEQSSTYGKLVTFRVIMWRINLKLG